MSWPQPRESWLVRHVWCIVAVVAAFAIGVLAGSTLCPAWHL